VYAQRFNTDGTPVGASFRANTTTSGSQYESDVATHADGSFVVSWRSDNQDGSGAGIYFQRFDASANKLGPETLANTLTASNQYEAKVASLVGGGFVIVWRDDNGADGSGNAVFGQRFDAAGNKLGAQFLVNETTSGSQYQPDVVGLDNGGFVVTFYNDNYDISGSGTTADVYIREYDASGNAIDGQRKVNSFPSSTQSEPPSPTWAATTSSSPGAPTPRTAATPASTSSSSAAPPSSPAARPARCWTTSAPSASWSATPPRPSTPATRSSSTPT
jgi:hypothetical protein